jgi:hypothetical protein
MSDYSKSTNFTSKDTLPTGNAGKIVKGTELDTEFTAISSAIASKADISSPALLGTPTSPTATSGTNTTQIASTAFVKAAIDTLALGNMSTQAKTAVDITGGTIVGITDLIVADGGTGASSITANSVILGNGTSALSGNLVAPGTSGNVLKSNGTTWTSAAAAVTSGLGHNGETWHDVSGSRSKNTTYTNSYSYPIMVEACFSNSNSYAVNNDLVVGGVTVSRFRCDTTNGQTAGTVSGVVPPGVTYSITSPAITTYVWAELY